MNCKEINNNVIKIDFCKPLEKNNYIFFIFEIFDIEKEQIIFKTEGEFTNIFLKIKDNNLIFGDKKITLNQTGKCGIYLGFKENEIELTYINKDEEIETISRKINYEKINNTFYLSDKEKPFNGNFCGVFGELDKLLNDFDKNKYFYNFFKNNTLEKIKTEKFIKKYYEGFINYEIKCDVNGYFNKAFGIENRKRYSNYEGIITNTFRLLESEKNILKQEKIKKQFYFSKDNDRWGRPENHNFIHLNIGYIKVPKTGKYDFYISSDDFSVLFIPKCYKNKTIYYPRNKSFQMDLNEGDLLFFEYFFHERLGNYGYNLKWKIPGKSDFETISEKYLKNKNDRLHKVISKYEYGEGINGSYVIADTNLKENEKIRLIINCGDFWTRNNIFLKNKSGKEINIEKICNYYRNNDMYTETFYLEDVEKYLNYDGKYYLVIKGLGNDKKELVARTYIYTERS